MYFGKFFQIIFRITKALNGLCLVFFINGCSKDGLSYTEKLTKYSVKTLESQLFHGLSTKVESSFFKDEKFVINAFNVCSLDNSTFYMKYTIKFPNDDINYTFNLESDLINFYQKAIKDEFSEFGLVNCYDGSPTYGSRKVISKPSYEKFLKDEKGGYDVGVYIWLSRRLPDSWDEIFDKTMPLMMIFTRLEYNSYSGYKSSAYWCGIIKEESIPNCDMNM